MIATLANLYTTPADVVDEFGSEGALLRLDDHENATGQTITVTATSLAGAISLSVLPLQVPLLRGSVFEFDGAGMTSVVEVRTSSTAAVGATSLSVNPLEGDVLALASAFDSGVNIALAARLIKACNYGTQQVNLYCTPRYDESQLVVNARQNGSVNRWATALAAQWLGRRRGQSAPRSVVDAAKESIDEMKMVRTSMLSIEGIGTRTSGWPFISNVTVDQRYEYRKIRVEQCLSELTPTQYPQAIDWSSVFFLEW